MSARARRRPKHRPSTKAAPTPEQQYRRMVPALLQAERDAADRIEDIVRKVANLAQTTVDGDYREQVRTALGGKLVTVQG